LHYFTFEQLEKFAKIAISASKLAGEAILKFYKTDLLVDYKIDGSPLTMADTSANRIIIKTLLTTYLPIVSEESIEIPFESNYYWLVDPLDGTKDFLAGNDEFTINIALIEIDKPVIGIVFAPALNELFVGIKGETAWAEINGELKIAKNLEKSDILKMAISRFHDHYDANFFATENKIQHFIPIGSSLKYGRLIFGEADVFPRLVGSSEWDTAAGQAILEAAGGLMLDWNTGDSLRYNKTNRRNGRFIAIRSPYKFSDFIYQKHNSELL